MAVATQPESPLALSIGTTTPRLETPATKQTPPRSPQTLITINEDCIRLIVDLIAPYDIVAFRSTCQKLKDVADYRFLSTFFRDRMQLCTTDGLETLIDIVTVPRLRQAMVSLSFVVVSPDMYSSLAKHVPNNFRTKTCVKGFSCAGDETSLFRYPESMTLTMPVIHMGPVRRHAYKLGEQECAKLTADPGNGSVQSRLVKALAEGSSPLNITLEACTYSARLFVAAWRGFYRSDRQTGHDSFHTSEGSLYDSLYGVTKLRQSIEDIYIQTLMSMSSCKAICVPDSSPAVEQANWSSHSNQLRGQMLTSLATALFAHGRHLVGADMTLKWLLPGLMPQSVAGLSGVLQSLRTFHLNRYDICTVKATESKSELSDWLQTWFTELHSIEELSIVGYSCRYAVDSENSNAVDPEHSGAVDLELSNAIIDCLPAKRLRQVSLSSLSLTEVQWSAVIEKLGSGPLSNLAMEHCHLVNTPTEELFSWPVVLQHIPTKTRIARLQIDGLYKEVVYEVDGNSFTDTLWLDMEPITTSRGRGTGESLHHGDNEDSGLDENEGGFKGQGEDVQEPEDWDDDEWDDEWNDGRKRYRSSNHMVWTPRSEIAASLPKLTGTLVNHRGRVECRLAIDEKGEVFRWQ